MIAAVVCGLLLSAGIWAVVRGMFPAPPPLARRIAETSDSGHGSATGAGHHGSPFSRLSMRLVTLVQGDLDRFRQDLAVVDEPVEEFASDKVKAGGLGAMIVGGFLVATRLASGPLLLIALILGFVGFYFSPDATLKRKAAARRQEFVDALTAFIGLVSVSIAGGGGVMSAMNAAATLGDSWPLVRLRALLDSAATKNQSPWVSLDELGVELGIPALVELGASMSLAGQSGATVSDSLASRAQSARGRQLAQRLADEERKSESLGIPVVVMLLGWMAFLGYPAVLNLVAV